MCLLFNSCTDSKKFFKDILSEVLNMYAVFIWEVFVHRFEIKINKTTLIPYHGIGGHSKTHNL